MKILFCNYEYPPLGGGGGVVMAALARSLAQRHEVTVLTSRALDLPRMSDDAGVKVIRSPVFLRRELATASLPSMLSYLPSAIFAGLRMPRSEFDIVNTHFALPTGPVGDLLARWFRIPNVLSIHGGDLYDPSKSMSPHRHAWLRAPIRGLLRRADAVVGQSNNTVKHVSSIYAVDRDVDLIPLGIDRPVVTGVAARSDFDLPEEAFVIATVGRQVARKRTTQLVQALGAPGMSNAHLLVVGSGPEEPALATLATRVGARDRLHLLGYVSEQRKYAALQVADVFASTTQHEGFGLVFLEAMAFGLPIVCYDEGGQVDFLTTGRTGSVIKLNDETAFVTALRSLIEQPSRRREYASNNLRAVEEYFIDRCAERYEAVFQRCLDARQAGPLKIAAPGSGREG